jgi:hypothetical protein
MAWGKLKDCVIFLSDTVIDELKNTAQPIYSAGYISRKIFG